MAVTFEPILISTPDPLNLSKWLATESPNNFRLSRKDYLVTFSAPSGGFLQITITPSVTAVVPILHDEIAVYDYTTKAMLTGTLTNVVGYPILITDIPWVAGMNITYMNDNSLHGGYYFEGQLTINNILQTLTIIASPDSFGYADLDVSGILRIKTALGKNGDYSALIMSETNKSGKFTFEYRGRWYLPIGDSPDDYTTEINTWYYGECVRSEEQGSNLYEYVATPSYDAPFLNLFDQPVFFLGLPFDLSFILPLIPQVTPELDIIITIKRYNSMHTNIGTDIYTGYSASFEGFINSLNIDPATIENEAKYLTAEIEII